MISFTCVVITVFVFTKILKKIFLALYSGDTYQHFSVCYMTVFQITLESIEGDDILAIAFLDQLKRRDIALALSDVNI